jgi:hypothetical protein
MKNNSHSAKISFVTADNFLLSSTDPQFTELNN